MKRNMWVNDMHRWLIILVAAFLLSDPGLSLLGHIHNGKDYLVAIMIAFFTAPWIVSQLDN